MMRLTGIAAALALATAAVACGGADSTSNITAPSGTVVTDTFNDTVPVGGASIKNFSVTVGGTVSVTLLSTSPQQTLTMGLGIGNPSSSGACALISGGSTTTVAGTAAQLSGSLAAGSYCLAVVDIGNAAGPITYSATVAHT
jgi:hypothetical protein